MLPSEHARHHCDGEDHDQEGNGAGGQVAPPTGKNGNDDMRRQHAGDQRAAEEAEVERVPERTADSNDVETEERRDDGHPVKGDAEQKANRPPSVQCPGEDWHGRQEHARRGTEHEGSARRCPSQPANNRASQRRCGQKQQWQGDIVARENRVEAEDPERRHDVRVGDDVQTGARGPASGREFDPDAAGGRAAIGDPPADRGLRRDHAVEFSVFDDHPQGVAGTGCRLHRGVEARQ